MAMAIVGGAFFSTLFEKLFDKLGSSEYVNFFRESKVNERLLKKLQITLMSAEQLHSDAEEKQFGNAAVRKWLFELKDAIMAAEELLDEINYEALRYEHEAESGSGFGKRLKLSVSGSSRSFDEELEEIRDSLEHIMKQKEFYGIKEGVKERTLVRLPAPLVEESRVYGRNNVKEKIVNQLLFSDDSDGKISVIPIVGMGGVGKTTLAQIVYEDERVRNHFDVKAWATVSAEFDMIKITKAIMVDITPKECKLESLGQLQRKLKEELKEKKFLIVLDDVWNEKYEHWDVLTSPFQSGACGSKVIVTTRSDKVVKVMGKVQTHDLGELPDDNCWRLFSELVFGNANSDSCQGLREIGKEIVKKCKGLPLAVKALGGLLRSVKDREEWKKILKNNIWELQLEESTSNNILPSLWLSYYYLPSHLKRCFTYCSIFPKDYEITEDDKEKIILLWMAEGLLQSDQKGKRTLDVGDEYFHDLVARSLLQRSSKDRSIIVMHDRVHDLAMFLSGEFCFWLKDYDKTKLSGKTRYFSYSNGYTFWKFEGLSSAKSLHTCVGLPLTHERYLIPQSEDKLLIPVSGCLRALSLSQSSFRNFPPNSIGKLKLLRYLDLSYTHIKEISNTLCSFYYLQTLRLSYCRSLTELPTDMGNLVNLLHLEIMDVPLLKMPHKMCNLKDLQTLSQFVLGENDCSSINELGGLHHLAGELAIFDLQNVDNVRDVSEANLKEKKYLNKMAYHWSSDGGHSQKEENILYALQPHTNVKNLHFQGYGGKQFPSWVGRTSYANLVTLKIINCEICLLPPLGQLPSLEDLSISNCHNVAKIGAEFYGASTLSIMPFRTLRVLEFKDMPRWQKWSFPERQQDSGSSKLNIGFSGDSPSSKTLEEKENKQTDGSLPETRQIDTVFPSLEQLHIDNCSRLQLDLSGNFLFRSNIKELYVFGYSKDTPIWIAEPPPHLSILSYEHGTAFLESHLPSTITSICIHSLRNLEVLNGQGFQHLTFLKKLEILYCLKLQSILGEMLPTSLKYLHIRSVSKLNDLGKGFQHLTSLEELKIKNCDTLECFAGETLPTSLKSLRIISVPKLKDLDLQHLVSLKKLSIYDCGNVLPSLEEGLPTTLTSLRLGSFQNLKDLSRIAIQRLVSLRELEIRNCKNLWMLPEEGLPQSLLVLRVEECPLLEIRCRRDSGLDWPKIVHIPSLKIGSFVYGAEA